MGLPRSRADIQEFIEKNDDGLLRILAALRDIAQVPGLAGETVPPPTIVLAIDQGEELFNEDGHDEASRLIAILTRTLKADRRVLALVAMRSDAFPQLQSEPRLAELAKDTFTLDMMLEGSYRAVIEEPARLVRPNPLRIDPQLIDALLEDISGQDALPLLAFTLAHLYEHYAADNELSLSGYEKLGRLKGVIDTTVKEAFAEGVAEGALPKDPKAQLALARAAIERRDTAAWRAALARADQWLQRMWADSPALRRQRAQLRALRELPLAISLPTLGSTLQQLRQTRAAR